MPDWIRERPGKPMANAEDQIWEAMRGIMDPEIPVISLVEMGIVREVRLAQTDVTIVMTPTFSGCPALVEMKELIEEAVIALGYQPTVETQFNPPWTSDWITDAGRAKLKAFGLAPPRRHGGNVTLTFFDLVPCPRCGSTNTRLQNSFGTTLCRAIWTCNDCLEPFEQFKPL